MDPVSVVAMVGTVAAVINNVAIQIMAIKQLHDQIKTADAHLMSLIAQLNSIKAALAQIKELIQTAEYDEQLVSDLELSLQASQLHMDYIDSKIAKLKTKNAAMSLKFRSRVRVVFESNGMDACLARLNHQATALNLLITVLTSKTVTEQRAMLQRSGTRKIFKQIKEDNASVLDETSSIRVLRDGESIRRAAIRANSEPIINKSPWKRFGFDSQILGSRAYGAKRKSRSGSDKQPVEEDVLEVETESADEAATLVEEPDQTLQDLSLDTASLTLDSTGQNAIRFSRMLAFDTTLDSILTLVDQAKYLWNATEHKSSQSSVHPSSVQNHRLSTRYFDLSIHVQPVTSRNHNSVSSDFLACYRDVSSILFAASLSTYVHDSIKQEKELALFARIANDYHLWLAKIILFLDTSDLDPYGAQGFADDVASKFLSAAKAGASNDRIHVVTGETDEMAAGRIFAVCNEMGKVQEEKWAGLTRSPTY